MALFSWMSILKISYGFLELYEENQHWFLNFCGFS